MDFTSQVIAACPCLPRTPIRGTRCGRNEVYLPIGGNLTPTRVIAAGHCCLPRTRCGRNEATSRQHLLAPSLRGTKQPHTNMSHCEERSNLALTWTSHRGSLLPALACAGLRSGAPDAGRNVVHPPIGGNLTPTRVIARHEAISRQHLLSPSLPPALACPGLRFGAPDAGRNEATSRQHLLAPSLRGTKQPHTNMSHCEERSNLALTWTSHRGSLLPALHPMRGGT
jgi:hypothetical protein